MATFSLKKSNLLITTGTAGPAASTSRGLFHYNIGIKTKSHSRKINFNVFSFLHKLFVYTKFQAVNIKCVIRIFWLVQSHGKRRATSAAGIKKNPYGGWFLALKIIFYLRFCRISNYNHLKISLFIYLFFKPISHLIVLILITHWWHVNVMIIYFPTITSALFLKFGPYSLL